MRKYLIILSFLLTTSVSNAAISSIQTRPGGASNSIQYNNNGTFGGTTNISVTTVTFADGTVLTSAAGGSFGAIRVEDGGALVVNTSTVNFNGDQFIVTNDGGDASVKLNNSSVTLMGSTFNTANVLVKLNASALIPNELLDNSSVTKLGSIIALGSETTGNYVKNLVAGLGMAVGSAGVGATPTVAFTPSLVTGNQTFGANNTASIVWCFGIIGTDPCFTFSNNLVTVTNLTVSNTLTATNATITNLTAGGLDYPTSDGAAGQTLITDGAGNLSFDTIGSGSTVVAVSSGGVVVSSPTSQIDFSSHTFTVELVGLTSSYVTLNNSSVTLLGPSIDLGTDTTGDYVSSITITAPLLGNTSGHVTISVDKSSVTLLGPSIDVDELPAHGYAHEAGEIDEIDVTGLSGTLSTPQTIMISTDSVYVHTSSGINFIPGSNITITGEAGDGVTNITITGEAGGSGGGYDMEPATVTIQAAQGLIASTITVSTISFNYSSGTVTENHGPLMTVYISSDPNKADGEPQETILAEAKHYVTSGPSIDIAWQWKNYRYTKSTAETFQLYRQYVAYTDTWYDVFTIGYDGILMVDGSYGYGFSDSAYFGIYAYIKGDAVNKNIRIVPSSYPNDPAVDLYISDGLSDTDIATSYDTSENDGVFTWKAYLDYFQYDDSIFMNGKPVYFGSLNCKIEGDSAEYDLNISSTIDVAGGVISSYTVTHATSPATRTETTYDWDFGNYSVVRASASTDINISGFISDNGGKAGQFLTIFNIGPSTLTFQNEGGSSYELNRIYCERGDQSVRPGGSIQFWYDGTKQRWVVIKNPVYWNEIRGMPAGFADGTDDVGGGSGVSSAYGALYLSSSSANIIDVTTTPVKLSIFKDEGESYLTSLSTTTGEITVSTTGVFSVYAMLSSSVVNVGFVNIPVYYAFAVNGSTVGIKNRSWGTVPLSMAGILSLNKDDIVSVYVSVGTTTPTDIFYRDAQLVIAAVGGVGGGAGGGDNLGNHIATMTVTAGYGIDASTITVSTLTVTSSATFQGPATFWGNVTFNGVDAMVLDTDVMIATLTVTSSGTFEGPLTVHGALNTPNQTHQIHVVADLAGAYDIDHEWPLMWAQAARYPNGIIISSWTVQANVADPTTEIDANLKYCDDNGLGAFPGANPVLIDVLDTTTGNSNENDMSASDLGSGVIPVGKKIYLELDADPADATTFYELTIFYRIP